MSNLVLTILLSPPFF